MSLQSSLSPVQTLTALASPDSFCLSLQPREHVGLQNAAACVQPGDPPKGVTGDCRVHFLSYPSFKDQCPSFPGIHISSAVVSCVLSVIYLFLVGW